MPIGSILYCLAFVQLEVILGDRLREVGLFVLLLNVGVPSGCDRLSRLETDLKRYPGWIFLPHGWGLVPGKLKHQHLAVKDVRVKIQKKVHRVMQRLKVKAVQIWTPSGCISCLGSSEMLVNSCDVSHEQHKYKTYKRTHAACPTKTCLAIRHFSGAFSLVSPVDGLLRLLLWWAQMQNHWEPCRLSWLHLHTTYNPMMAGIGHVINCHLQFKEILILNLFWFLMIICKLYYLDVTYSFLIKSRVPNENICWTAKLWRDFLGPCDRCDSCTLRPGIDLFNHDAHAQLGCENWFWCFWTPSKSFWNIFYQTCRTRLVPQCRFWLPNFLGDIFNIVYPNTPQGFLPKDYSLRHCLRSYTIW